MALRNLVDKDCGGNNPLVNLTQHFNSGKFERRWSNQDEAHGPGHQHQEESRIGQLEGPNRFSMNSLLQTLGPANNTNDQPMIPGELNGVPTSHQLNPNSHHWLESFISSQQESGSSMVSKPREQDIRLPLKPLNQRNIMRTRPLNQTPNYIGRSRFNQWSSANGPGMISGSGGIMAPAMFQNSFQPRLNLDIDSKSAQEYLEDFHRQLEEEKSKVKDEEALRKDFDTSTLPEEARKFIESMRDDPEIQSTDFANFIKKIGDGELEITNDGIISHFEDTLSQAWAEEFTTAQEAWQDNTVTSDHEFWDTVSQDWAMNHNQDSSSTTGFPDILSDFATDLSETHSLEYRFNPNNPYQDAIDPFKEGLKKLELGDIPSAVLHFEAACQKDPSQHLYWQYLGTSQAQNEHDTQAISALKKCIELKPDNLVALMALAVSYTNQAETRNACDSLYLWITRNPNYAYLVENRGSPLEQATSEKLRKVRDMYLQAARLSPRPLDADIQCGLGVLLNLTAEYGKAADCFRAALSVRPDDSTLWNRLGATLANGNKSEEAVAAYEKALSISPGFIRSRFNLGIACINLGAHRQAAEHFLTVLNLQKAGHGADGRTSYEIMSNNAWTTLRLVLSLMNRQDLYKCIDKRDLDSLNQEFNINPSEFSKSS